MSHQLSRQASHQETRVLIPPRPNLGPERWSEEHSGVLPFWSAGTALLVLLAGTIGIFWYRRRRSGRRATTPSPAEGLPPSHATELLNLACQIREDLAARFGPSLRAQTTQEIAADLEVKEVLGVEHFEPMICLLALADRVKFATLPENGDEESILDEISAWEALRVSLMARLAAKPQREVESP
ncbi:MAG: hypothetical protein JO161_06295 [Planctomycetaceae bacterium]|nr:hypothetical protein [Planctomycetaceae bacterium]